MDPFDRARLTNLRDALIATRQEKSGLVKEIASSATTPERKRQALRRYSMLMRKLQKTVIDLEEFLDLVKHAPFPRHFR